MNKSIETIWKEGFLQKDALVAPKLNNLYNQKSIHLIDKFKQRYRFNFRFLIIFAFVVLVLSFPVGLKYMGIPIFCIFIGMAIFSKKHFESLDNINKNSTSLAYLKSYDKWLKERISLFKNIYRYVYPLIFLSTVLGFWFLDLGDRGTLGESLTIWIGTEFSNNALSNLFQVIVLLGTFIGAGLISYFSDRFYQSDISAMYGNLMNRLEELIRDMEELNATN